MMVGVLETQHQGPGLARIYVLSQEPGSKLDGTQSFRRNASLSLPG